MNNINDHGYCLYDAEVAYKLFHDLKAEIKATESDFNSLTDRNRQQYLIDLFEQSLMCAKGIGRPYAPVIKKSQ